MSAAHWIALLGIGVMGCTRSAPVSAAPAPASALAPGLRIETTQDLSGLRVERIHSTIDGALASSSPVFRHALAAGEHTIGVRLEASFPCGSSDARRGRIVLGDKRTYVVRNDVAAAIDVHIRAARDLIAVEWRAVGEGLAEADMAAFGPTVTGTECEPESLITARSTPPDRS